MPDRLTELKNKLLKAAQEFQKEMFQDYVNYRPLAPWVLVYVLPRDQMTKSGIILAGGDKQQNKVTLEGIVLDTWEPIIGAEDMHGSCLSKGDLVLFPHYAGQPLSAESANSFRLVKEFSDIENEVRGDDCIYATLNYSSQEIKESLFDKEILGSDNQAERLFYQYIVYPKKSITISGM